jgi:hypothetical protein
LEYVFSQARHSHPGDALINRLMRALRAAAQCHRPTDHAFPRAGGGSLDRPPDGRDLRTAQTQWVQPLSRLRWLARRGPGHPARARVALANPGAR